MPKIIQGPKQHRNQYRIKHVHVSQEISTEDTTNYSLMQKIKSYQYTWKRLSTKKHKLNVDAQLGQPSVSWLAQPTQSYRIPPAWLLQTLSEHRLAPQTACSSSPAYLFMGVFYFFPTSLGNVPLCLEAFGGSRCRRNISDILEKSMSKFLFQAGLSLYSLIKTIGVFQLTEAYLLQEEL